MTINRFLCNARSVVVVCLLLALAAPSVLAQNIKVSGTVMGPDGPEVGALVYSKSNTGNGTMTDLDGKYTITVAKDEILVFSSMGLTTQEVKVAGRTTVNVELHEDRNLLDEVVIVGYGAQRKKFVVGSVSQVTADDIKKAPVTNVQNMLTGRLAGLTNIQTSGTPGDDATQILVRGFSTFNNSSPLIIVDGVERQMTYLNPNDVASVSVLKDAATASIYGVRGANGVILVTTKSGARGSSKIAYDGSISFDTNTAVPQMCNAEQYIYYHNLARQMDGLDPYWTPENIQKLKDMGVYAETDWLKEIYNPYGTTKQHNISASGGNDRVRYYTSIGYMDQDGILKNTSFDRYNLRANVDANLAAGLTFNINVAGNHSKRHKPGYSFAISADDQGSTTPAEFSPITQAFYAIPILGYTEDGIEVGFHNGTYTRTPYSALTKSGYQNQTRWNMETSAKLEYDFGAGIKALDGLKASVFAAYNFSFTSDRNLMTPFKLYGLEPSSMTLTPMVSMGISKMSFNKSASFGWNMTVRPQIEYNKTVGNHGFSFLGLFERYKYYGDTMTAYGSDYYTDTPMDISLAPTRNQTLPSGSYSQSGFASFAARLGYNFAGKYIAEFTMREDASYKFAPENRWGFFPSLALGWVVSDEDFFDTLKTAVDFLKIRASVGTQGNDDTSAYLYMQTYSVGTGGNQYVAGGKANTTFLTDGYVYDDLTWSHTTAYNVGLEARFFKNKLSAEFDYFYKLTDRILEYDSIGTYSPSLGGNNPSYMNSGKLDNRGFELTLRHDNWFDNGLTYSITGMMSWSHNRVLSRRLTDARPSYRAVLGEPMGSIYGFHCLGMFQTQEQVDNYPTAPSGWVDLGDLMYEDQNGDGRINSGADYVKIGRSRIPEMTFSMNFEVGYKNLSLSALFQGATMCNYSLSGAYNNTTDNTMLTRAFYGAGNAVLYLVEDAWTPENPGAKYPRLRSVTNANNAWASDWWVVDGSYVRLKNLQLTYALPKSWMSAAKMDSMRVFIAGTNLITLSHFKYVDPENPGVNNGYYPQQRTMSLGVNLTF